MHSTTPADLNFTAVNDSAGKVFVTTDIQSFPGNSGGPLCVLTNGVYYPAAIYLGGVDEARVRAINGAVADLINRAEVSSFTGDNSTGGGVVILTAGSGSSFNP